MASISVTIGQIRERRAGRGRPMYYCLDIKEPQYLKLALRAHELIMGTLAPKVRETITAKEMKSAVQAYLAFDNAGKKALLEKIALSGYGKNDEKPEVSLEQLAETWFEQKRVQGVTDKQLEAMLHEKKIILDFFFTLGLRTIVDLKLDTAYTFLAWRSTANYNNRQTRISASTMKHNLQTLKQMAKVAARNGWLPNATLWDDVEVKIIAGVNTKIVEPLSVDLQRRILAFLKNARSELHDSILFLLLTGIRVGELDNIKPESIRGNGIVLHGEAVGRNKPISGKTAAAARTLPVCPTIAEIFRRGHVFKISAANISLALKRNPFVKAFPGIHPHRFRHTFAVNKLLSQAATLQMVSYQLGHSDIGTTANLYGKFVPEHFKVGFEEAIKERRELVEWLENLYFL
ncbi:MAG: tyrosine-type recombinase/integrase [Fibromonadales bacterium]|nr:tyrosine-type recombinase/integrase [Fibromonadales bacterium]